MFLKNLKPRIPNPQFYEIRFKTAVFPRYSQFFKAVNGQYSLNFTQVEVRIGHANLTNDWSFAVRVEKEIPHPDYKLKPFPVNDIAILKLVNKLELESPMVKIYLITETLPSPFFDLMSVL